MAPNSGWSIWWHESNWMRRWECVYYSISLNFTFYDSGSARISITALLAWCCSDCLHYFCYWRSPKESHTFSLIFSYKSLNGSFVLPSALKGKWLAPSVRCLRASYSILPKLTHFPFLFYLLPWEADSRYVCGRCQAAASTSFLQRASALLQNGQTSTSQPFICSSVCASNKGPNFWTCTFCFPSVEELIFSSIKISKLYFLFQKAEILTVSYCSKL